MSDQPGPNGVADPDDSEVQVDQRALVNILSRYPGPFDVLRELIQNADDAEAHKIEIHLQSEEFENSRPVGKLDVNSFEVSKWIIKNDGKPFEKQDWERLEKIAHGNRNSTKVGAFGVGFYSVLSKSDRPLVKSNGNFLQFRRGEDGKLRKSSGTCSTDSWTSIELELREQTQLPWLVELTRFLVSSVAFLANVDAVSVHVDSQRVLYIRRQAQSPVDVEIPKHLSPSTWSQVLTAGSIQRTVQKLTVDADDCVFTSRSGSNFMSPEGDTDEILVERHGNFDEGRQKRTFQGGKTILEDNTITHDLYTATARVDLSKRPKMKEEIETNLKSLPDSFPCKLVYFNSEQSLAGIRNSQSPKTKQLASVFCGPQGIFPDDDSGRLFIGQSTNQTTGIGLHVSAHFLPTMERGAIDLANGQIKAWNEEVLKIAGLLARIIYEEEMQRAAATSGDDATDLGLSTMARFAFGPTEPHSKVSQILQAAFFSCSRSEKPPLLVVSNDGILSASDPQFRQSNKDLLFLKTYRVLHDDIDPDQRTEIITRYKIPLFKFGDILREFEIGVTEDAMKSFFTWWEDARKNTPPSESAKNARDMFCERFASRGVLHSNDRGKIKFENIKYYTFFPLPKDLSHPNSIYIDVSANRPSKDSLDFFHWTRLPLLVWLEHVCSQVPALISSGDSDVGYRILRFLVQFALVEDLPQSKDAAAKLVKDLKCIPTTKGRESREVPDKSYFEEADVCQYLPVAQENDFMTIPPTSIETRRGFEFRFVDREHIRGVLSMIGVREMMEWKDMIRKLDKSASEGTNYRLLQYLIMHKRKLTDDQFNDLKKNKVFYSEKAGRRPATELLLPSDETRKAGDDAHKPWLPVLALSRNEMNALQRVADDRFGISALEVEAFIEKLGVERFPTLQTITALAASDELEIRQPALEYLLSNLDERYKAYKPENFPECAFIPTKCGTHARLDEVFISPVWETLGFKQPPKDLCRKLERLGVKADPPVDAIIKHFKTPGRTPPNPRAATEWFKILYEHGELPVQKLRDQLSTVPFVPVEIQSSTSPGSPTIEYRCPQECFIESVDTKEHHRRVFPFVNFGSKGNSFLEFCCAKKSPEASDILRKIMQDPTKYLETLDTDRYFDDLRTIALRLDSISADDKKAMKEARMFPVDGTGKTLLQAEQVLISDWESHDFGANINIAPKDDVLAKMYSEMGSVFLGTYVQHDVVCNPLPPKARCYPPFTRDEVILRIRCFMKRRDKSGRTEISFDDDASVNKLEVRPCKALKLTKRFAPPLGVLAKPEGERSAETEPAHVMAGFEFNEGDGSYILWMAGCPGKPEKLYHDIALALCHILLKTYGRHDVLLLVSLFEMTDERLMEYYGSDVKPGPSSVTKAPMQDNEKVQRPAIDNATLEDDAQDALDSLANADSESPDFTAPSQRFPDHGRQDKYCKRAHGVHFKEKKKLRDENTGIRFFVTQGDTKHWMEESTLVEMIGKFAKIISGLADHVFRKNAFAACCIFWNDDPEWMAFNQNQKFIFLNLAHYKSSCDSEKDPKEVATEWYLIMAHEIAHNVATDHDEHHGSLSTRLAVQYLPALQEHLRKLAPSIFPTSS